ncbi:hypothetical protein MASR1M42_17860 [Azonexus hydrophilus]
MPDPQLEYPGTHISLSSMEPESSMMNMTLGGRFGDKQRLLIYGDAGMQRKRCESSADRECHDERPALGQEGVITSRLFHGDHLWKKKN